ncbi:MULTISPECIES: hypothetical protein [Nocardioides]|uniref:DUF3352 domain-containing protein n=1 Tax=Nocardioides vastitatis TaxID=2568655 RepID=A0ABW0ZPF7_9ACTN|nr:hypothetical protein [Nocardioides sp.]THJ07459.1 hypothetical protein E7Z54_05355 [Nocardioides sp.]
MRFGCMGALVTCAVLLVGCTEDAKPVFQPEPAPAGVVTEYDEALEPSAAVLSLVPADATSLVVTDFEQLRLVLGLGTLESETTPQERARFWRMLPRTAALSQGLLRSVDQRLRQRFGFGQDDVTWEASYSGPVSGWVLAFDDEVPMRAVQRAVGAGVGPLSGAAVDTERRLVTSTTPPPIDDSWGVLPEVAALVGNEAASTYVERGCVDFGTVFGAGTKDRLASAPAAALRSLDPLEAFAVSFGGELATVQLGEDRADAFDRLRLADVMPPTDPEFGLAMGRGVADPSTGRLGYTIGDPAAAVELTLARKLPFAICED